jgi:LysM repeat protein
VQVSGDRLLANRNIYLNLNKWLAAPQQASASRTDTQGRFTAEIEIPHQARVGEFWVVTAETAENPQSRGISNLFAVAWPPDPNAPRIYTISPEDTLNEIAERYGRPVRSIIAANPDIENMNQILAGTRIIIPSPTETITITPTRGPAGSQIQVRGLGFPPEAKVEIGIGRSAESYDVFETVITDELGEFASQLSLPASALPRQRWVVVAILARAGVTEVTAVSDPFTIVQAEQSSNETLITIWPMSGPPGSELLVSAAGFPPTVPIQVGLARQSEEPQAFTETWTQI